MSAPSPRNRLARETSLYLRQHAGNPVDWYPWGPEALEKARGEDRPILLSVGYSACHWCHVMERESFEDEAIAALMNELFVCIKVDREERPDLDHVYMKALQAMTGHGGWPMTVFLTPQGEPFYAGTYFPPEDRGSMPGLPRVLAGVARAYSEQREEVVRSAQRVADFLSQSRAKSEGSAAIGSASLLSAAERLVEIMDAEHGGFGKAPKFPGATCLTYLLGAERIRSEQKRSALLRLSLDRMAAGGIYDHVGGGFHRYSTDRYWLVPHFEKMLYDQALLAELYLDARTWFREDSYGEVVTGILDYVVREMESPRGGYYASQDADSEGEEGRFFVWSREEIFDVLGDAEAAVFCQAYGVTSHGNWEGTNILHAANSADGSDLRRGTESGESGPALARALARLRERRSRRVRPGRDEKILADWNGLMLSAMAKAGRVLDRQDYTESARRAADLLRSRMWIGGRLQHVFAGDKAKVDGFLDDYAFVGRGCLDLFEATGRRADLDTAEACARALLDRFGDGANGGFFFTAAEGQPLIARTKELLDGAVPSGNSVAAELLLRMWALTGREEYRRAGEGVLSAFGAEALENPYGGAHLLCVADRLLRGWATVVIVGGEDGRVSLESTALASYHPEVGVYSLKDASAPWLPEALADKPAPGLSAVAYVCRGTTCSAALGEPAELASRLSMEAD